MKHRSQPAEPFYISPRNIRYRLIHFGILLLQEGCTMNEWTEAVQRMIEWNEKE